MLQTTRSLGVSASLALAFAATSAFGAAYQGSAYEGFDYTANATMDNTFGGGTGWNATGNASLANSTNWGSATPFNATGSRAITSTGDSVLVSGAGQIGREFGQTVDSGTFYFSFQVQKTVDQVRTVNMAFFGTTATTPNERFSIGQIANNANLKLADGTADPDALTKANLGQFAVLVSKPTGAPALGTAGVYTSSTPQSFAVNTTFRVVGRIDFDFNVSVPGADRLRLYIDPVSLTDEPSLAYIDLQGIDLGALTGFRLFAGATQTNQSLGSQTGLTYNASAAKFDEIRLGTNYLSVTGASPVPEPSSYAALLGLAGLGFAASRRRRA